MNASDETDIDSRIYNLKSKIRDFATEYNLERKVRAYEGISENFFPEDIRNEVNNIYNELCSKTVTEVIKRNVRSNAEKNIKKNIPYFACIPYAPTIITAIFFNKSDIEFKAIKEARSNIFEQITRDTAMRATYRTFDDVK